MYDMYDWHRLAAGSDDPVQPAGGSRPARRCSPNSRSRARRASEPASRALQAALDRRDNGGDAAVTRGE